MQIIFTSSGLTLISLRAAVMLLAFFPVSNKILFLPYSAKKTLSRKRLSPAYQDIFEAA
jgi:hypothetical protein